MPGSRQVLQARTHASCKQAPCQAPNAPHRQKAGSGLMWCQACLSHMCGCQSLRDAHGTQWQQNGLLRRCCLHCICIACASSSDCRHRLATNCKGRCAHLINLSTLPRRSIAERALLVSLSIAAATICPNSTNAGSSVAAKWPVATMVSPAATAASTPAYFSAGCAKRNHCRRNPLFTHKSNGRAP